MTTAIDIVRANFSARTDIQGELRSIDEAATADNRAYTETEAARIDELRSSLEAIDARIQANLAEEHRSRQLEDGLGGLLQVMADRERGDLVDTRSAGARFVESEEFRSFAEAGGNGRSQTVTFAGLDLRSVTDVTNASTSGGAFINPQRLARVGADFLNRRVFLSDLLPVIPVDGPIEYVQDKTPLADLADKAAEVSEGGSKPQAGPTMEVVNESPATIAVWANLTRRVARQAPSVQAYLDTRLRYALKRRLDKQVINGDGNSPNISGLLDRTGILTEAPGSSEARAVTIRKAITTMEESESVPEIVVLNPADAELFDLLNVSSAGLHATPDLTAPPAQSAWGLQVVRSTAIASGTAALIDPMGVAILDEMAPRAYLTDSHASNFTSNILTLLLELDAGLAVFEPASILKVTFNGTT